MLHCKGADDADMMVRALREIEIYRQNGVDGVLVETYFGTYHQVEMVLEHLAQRKDAIPYGVNCLNVDAMGFVLAEKYHCDFIQVDSVGGHLKPRDDESLDAFFDYFRQRTDACLMGGVRFKYQPVHSGRSVEEDLKICMGRCDAVCVTQNATGQATSLRRIKRFRKTIGDFPLVVCAGLTADNVCEQLRVADKVMRLSSCELSLVIFLGRKSYICFTRASHSGKRSTCKSQYSFWNFTLYVLFAGLAVLRRYG